MACLGCAWASADAADGDGCIGSACVLLGGGWRCVRACVQGRLLGAQLDSASLNKASKALEKAMVNFYRHLMLLDNYALLNYTAFQKVRHADLAPAAAATAAVPLSGSSLGSRSSLFADAFALG
jgi:hypothetical protein